MRLTSISASLNLDTGSFNFCNYLSQNVKWWSNPRVRLASISASLNLDTGSFNFCNYLSQNVK